MGVDVDIGVDMEVMDLFLVSEEEEKQPFEAVILYVVDEIMMNFCMNDPKDLKNKFTMN